MLFWGKLGSIKRKTQKKTNKQNKIKQPEQGVGRQKVDKNITNIFKEFFETFKVNKSLSEAKLSKEKMKSGL